MEIYMKYTATVISSPSIFEKTKFPAHLIWPRLVFVLDPLDDGMDIRTLSRGCSSYLNFGSHEERLRVCVHVNQSEKR